MSDAANRVLPWVPYDPTTDPEHPLVDRVFPKDQCWQIGTAFSMLTGCGPHNYGYVGYAPHHQLYLPGGGNAAS